MMLEVYALHLGDHDYRYVGLTTKSAEERLATHRYNASTGAPWPVYSWMRKYGTWNVRTQLLESVDTFEQLGEAEIKWIAIFKAANRRLLNLTPGGIGSAGYLWTDEQKARMAASMVDAATESWKDSDKRANRLEGIRNARSDPIKSARMNTGILLANSNPDNPEKWRQLAVDTWKDPEIRAKRLEGMRKARLRRTENTT